MPLSQLFETCYWHQIQNEHFKKKNQKHEQTQKPFISQFLHLMCSFFFFFYYF